MWVPRSGIAFSGNHNAWLGPAIAIGAAGILAGCVCLDDQFYEDWQPVVEPAAAAARPRGGAVAKADDAGDETSSDIALDPELLTAAEPPSCAVDGADKPPAGSSAAGETADPNLLEIARLQLERDCYKDAERAVRMRLERLQRAIALGRSS